MNFMNKKVDLLTKRQIEIKLKVSVIWSFGSDPIAAKPLQSNCSFLYSATVKNIDTQSSNIIP